MRYIIGFLITIGLIILVLVLLLRGGGGSSTAPKSLNLADYARSDSTAQFIIDGPIVADQNHREVKIAVESGQVTFTLYQGYNNQVLNTQTYSNTQSAYTNFLKSLQHEGFTQGNNDPKMQDERGYCPLGQRKIYSFTDGTDLLMRYWSTGCSNTKTFEGKVSAVTQLFEAQVPNYNELVQGVPLQ